VRDLAVIVGGYLLGSMPFGYWLVLLLKGEDVRAHGSGNIGATNVWRAYGRSYGIPVILLDVAKGFVPALVGVLVSGDLLGVLAGGAAMAGHWRPLFLGFQRGGKTVATAGGVFWAVAPLVALVGAVVWCALFLVFRYASVASMGAGVALPVVAWAFGEPWPVIVFASLTGGVVVVLHRANIRRLREGTESRFHFGRAAKA
jgi:glycerol-3-phosphate acyltransferase PlsY